jgi:hypothetical protein
MHRFLQSHCQVINEFHLAPPSNGGALLVLPEGASRQDLKTDMDFFNVALQQGVAWFQHARHELRRRCKSLYLITGQDKARLWGLTSFRSASGTASLRIELGIDNTSKWKPSNSTTFRRSEDSQLPRPTHENQCVFLRGFMISERQASIAKWRSGQKVAVRDIGELGFESLRNANISENDWWPG